MIHVPRNAVPPLGLLEAETREMEAYSNFIKTKQKSKTAKPSAPRARKPSSSKNPSEPFTFKAYRLETVKTELERAFHSKCAYCESDYTAVANVRIEHFRPKGRVDREGMKSVGGYYWLAAEWRNLLPACERCNSPKRDFIPALNRKLTVGKANWFPLWEEATRARRPGDEHREYPLLLNPCDEDPEEYLVFDENGMVEPRNSLSKKRKTKAEKSIHVYGLGRLKLVKARHEHAKRVLGQIERVVENYEDWRASRRANERRRRLIREWDELQKFLAPDTPYISVAKHLIQCHVTDGMKQALERLQTATGRR